MSNSTSPDPTVAPAPPTRTWVKVMLALSLALNLAVGGLAVGAFLRDGPPTGGSRDLGLGPLTEALDHEGRKALRKAFFDRHPDFRADRKAMRAEFDALLVALRAEPFDPAALDAALSGIAMRNADRLASGRDLIATYLKSMDATARAAFADRVEDAISKFGGRRRD